MKNLLLLIIVSSILLLSCEKNELVYTEDGNYPTVYTKLNPDALSEARTTYFQNNKFMQSSLNKFGFCDLVEDNRTVDSPPLSTPLTESEAIAKVKDFVSKNPDFTGVKNADDLTFARINSSTGYWDGATYWHLKTSNQIVNNVEVLYSQISFNVKNKELHTCIGNWFPEIYIPANFNITQDKAKALLLNMVVSHYTIAGQEYTVKISSSDLKNSTTSVVVIPVEDEDKIELRVTWQINIPAVHYIIYVDVMTGEIISKQPTIIS